MSEDMVDIPAIRFHAMAVPRSKPWVKVTEDDLQRYLDVDLNTRYIKHKAATFLFPATESNIRDIWPGDTLIVDRALKPVPGRVIIAEIEGQLTLRRVRKMQDKFVLVTDREGDPPCIMTEENDYCWGVVTYAVRDLQPA
jgi:DNA polymerase V